MCISFTRCLHWCLLLYMCLSSACENGFHFDPKIHHLIHPYHIGSCISRYRVISWSFSLVNSWRTLVDTTEHDVLACIVPLRSCTPFSFSFMLLLLYVNSLQIIILLKMYFSFWIANLFWEVESYVPINGWSLVIRWLSLGNQLQGVRLVDEGLRARFKAAYPDVEVQPASPTRTTSAMDADSSASQMRAPFAGMEMKQPTDQFMEPVASAGYASVGKPAAPDAEAAA